MSETRMSAEEAIKTALDTLGVPVDRLFYDGEASSFVTYQLVVGTAGGFMDDEYTHEEYTYRVDIYSKAEHIFLLRKVKQVLRAAGFYGLTVDPEVYESETGYYHIPVEIKYMEV